MAFTDFKGDSPTMLNLMTVLAEDGHHIVNELPFPAWVFGWAIFAIFMFLLLATLSLRSVSQRHDDPSTDVAHHGGSAGHGSSH